MPHNPAGIQDVNLIVLSGPSEEYHRTLTRLGFVQVGTNHDHSKSLYRQGQVDVLVNQDKRSYGWHFFEKHGPCVSGFTFIVNNSLQAHHEAISRGAKPINQVSGSLSLELPFPAVVGIGEAVLYLADSKGLKDFYHSEFGFIQDEPQNTGAGFYRIDHFTHNVPKGQMDVWCEFYEKVFGFQYRRYFHIRGKATGLESKVMTSPSGNFSIPINEPTEAASQIQEFLDLYKGPGVQHVALLTSNIIETYDQLQRNGVKFLESPNSIYYQNVSNRVPSFDRAVEPYQRRGILIDGDDKGYLLQIFTQNMIGPIFFEVIERQNHSGFGEGNFQALFDSIEEDQRRRGVLKT